MELTRFTSCHHTIMFGLKSQPYLLVLLLGLGLLSHSVQSMRFEVKSGESKCISEDIRSDWRSFGNYTIVNPNKGQPLPESHNITVRVDTPSVKVIHYAVEVQSGQFDFLTQQTGKYVTCFFSTAHHPEITIDFDWKTVVPSKHWYNVAKKKDVDVMTSDVMALLETVSSILKEMSYFRKRGNDIHMFGWETYDRMYWLGLLSLFVCLSVAGLQLWHLKTFFQKNKII